MDVFSFFNFKNNEKCTSDVGRSLIEFFGRLRYKKLYKPVTKMENTLWHSIIFIFEILAAMFSTLPNKQKYHHPLCQFIRYNVSFSFSRFFFPLFFRLLKVSLVEDMVSEFSVIILWVVNFLEECSAVEERREQIEIPKRVLNLGYLFFDSLLCEQALKWLTFNKYMRAVVDTLKEKLDNFRYFFTSRC